jgi:hypothetical protein
MNTAHTHKQINNSTEGKLNSITTEQYPFFVECEVFLFGLTPVDADTPEQAYDGAYEKCKLICDLAKHVLGLHMESIKVTRPEKYSSLVGE